MASNLPRTECSSVSSSVSVVVEHEVDPDSKQHCHQLCSVHVRFQWQQAAPKDISIPLSPLPIGMN